MFFNAGEIPLNQLLILYIIFVIFNLIQSNLINLLNVLLYRGMMLHNTLAPYFQIQSTPDHNIIIIVSNNHLFR